MGSPCLIVLANHLWQSTLFAAAAGGLTRLLRKNSARARYLLWLAASAKFLVPFALLTVLGAQLPWLRPVHATHSPSLSIAAHLAAQITPFGGDGVKAPAPVPRAGDVALIAFGVLWALGTVVVAARWFARWTQVRRALCASTQTSLRFLIPVRSSSLQLEPAVVGILRPVLLLPQGMEQRLTSEELRAVLDHEACHVAWRDNMAAALHMLVEALFWFHPLIWWLGARLVEERERACDERVLAEGHTPESYAEGILKVCEHYLETRLGCIAGIGGAHLGQRIDAILKNRRVERLSAVRKLLITLAACATIAVPVAAGVLTSPPAQAEMPASDEPVFRNVSIQLAPSDEASRAKGWPFQFCSGIFHREGQTEGRVTVGCPKLRDFIADAYGVSEPQVVGKDWNQEPYYDITADDPILARGTADERAAVARNVPAMMRNLLAKHFGLVVRREEKQRIDGYALTISSGGSKLKPYAGGPSWKTSFWMSPTEGFDVTDYPVSTLVDFLQRILKRPVIDETGLRGHYEYKADWKPSPPGTPPDPVALAKALEGQLGLRLEAKPVTVEMIHVLGLKPPEEGVTHP